jgi:hypothetical protein
VRFDKLQHATRVHLSTDDNDRYRLYFYREQRLVGHQDLKPPGGRTGLRTSVITIAAATTNEGFDAVGILPLYGDSRYALGHLRFM